jgi:hypothetical protein
MLPPSLSQLPQLTVLRLDSNLLVGTIPPQWTSLQRLRRLTLGAQAGGEVIGGEWGRPACAQHCTVASC